MDNSLTTFKAISNFTTCLSEVFGDNNKPLKLYARLISKTTISHDKVILKHIAAFREFCISNRNQIASKDRNFNPVNITYSSRVYININTILKQSDTDTTSVIWKHILTISALVDPAGKAREILQDSSKGGSTNSTEADFLTNIIGKVEEHVNPDANPMEAVSSIMKSGIFTDLVGGMGSGLQDGTLDLSKLMNTVQNMVTTLNEQSTGQPNENGSSTSGEDPMNGLVSSMMASLNAGASSNGSGAGNPPDLSAIMGMMGPMLGALSGASGGIEPNSSNIITDKENSPSSITEID
jgi:hypothetical protein